MVANRKKQATKPKSSTSPAKENSPSRDAIALLAALANEGAYGWEGEEKGRARLIVAAPRRGVSVRVASFAPAAAAALSSAGLALWETGAASGRRRLRICDAGKARLAREAPPDGGDPFLAQHQPLARRRLSPGEDEAVLVDEAESPIAWLATRKGRDGKPMIDAACLEAGERLRRDLTFAQMMPRVTANWSATTASGSVGAQAGTYSDLAIAARQRAEGALRAVGGDFASLLFDVCGFLKGLEAIERERGWPRRAGKLVLTLALRQLARHYGLAQAAVGPQASRGVRHWGADDYRPLIDPSEP